MTNRQKAGLDRLEDEMIEDILEMSDDEIVEEFRAEGEDPVQLAAEMRRRIDQAIRERAKARLKEASAAVALEKKKDSRSQHRDASNPRARLQAFQVRNPGWAQNFSMAARKEGEQSDEDLSSLIDDLEELERDEDWPSGKDSDED